MLITQNEIFDCMETIRSTMLASKERQNDSLVQRIDEATQLRAYDFIIAPDVKQLEQLYHEVASKTLRKTILTQTNIVRQLLMQDAIATAALAQALIQIAIDVETRRTRPDMSAVTKMSQLKQTFCDIATDAGRIGHINAGPSGEDVIPSIIENTVQTDRALQRHDVKRLMAVLNDRAQEDLQTAPKDITCCLGPIIGDDQPLLSLYERAFETKSNREN